VETCADRAQRTTGRAATRQLDRDREDLQPDPISAAKGGLTISNAAKLTFQALDDLAFASSVGDDAWQDIQAQSYLPATLGPLVEFLFLMSAGVIPSSRLQWLRDRQIACFLKAWCNGSPAWLSQTRHCGFIRTQKESDAWEIASVDFLMNVQRAAQETSKLPGTIPGQMAAAILELAGNVEEHSAAPETGIIAFRATAGVFEFVVADQGIGILRSLRGSPEFLTLDDHGRAIDLALTDGVSRFQDPRRGHGFRPIFQGLTNLNGYLRFRSGDHAIIMDGTTPSLATAQLAQKPYFAGFFASVMCKAS
jgi:anti-sigma regulatory factor (Ser/Thr protein kinase)